MWRRNDRFNIALLMAEKKLKYALLIRMIKILFAQQDNRTTAISQGSYRIFRKLGFGKN